MSIVTILNAVNAQLDGDLAAAADWLGVVDLADRLGLAVFGRQFATQVASRPLVYLGRASDALALLPQAQEFAGAEINPGSAARFTLCLAHDGQIEEARRQLREQLVVLGLPWNPGEMMANLLAHLLESAVLVNDPEAGQWVAERLSGVAAWHHGYGVEPVARLRGDVARMRGDSGAARAEYTRALGWAASIQHRPEIALTRLALAELLLDHFLDERAEALDHLDFALKEFEAMKMAPSLARALALRERLA